MNDEIIGITIKCFVTKFIYNPRARTLSFVLSLTIYGQRNQKKKKLQTKKRKKVLYQG